MNFDSAACIRNNGRKTSNRYTNPIMDSMDLCNRKIEWKHLHIKN